MVSLNFWKEGISRSKLLLVAVILLLIFCNSINKLVSDKTNTKTEEVNSSEMLIKELLIC